MEIRKLICEELKLPWPYVCTLGNDRAIVFAHDNWIRTLVQTKALPKEFPRHSTLSNEEVGLLLQQFQGLVDKPWRKLEIRRIAKKDEISRKLPRQQKIDNRNSDLTYFQLLHYVSETNYVNRWKETQKMHSSKNKRVNYSDKYDLYNNVIREAIQRLNQCPIIDSQQRSESQSVENRVENSETGFYGHLNLLLPICVFESSSGFYLVYPYMKYSVSDCVVFSPAIFAKSTVKPLFIIYQILQATRHLHDNGLFLGDINLSDIRIDSNLWIYAEPKILNGIISEDVQLTKTLSNESKHIEDRHHLTATSKDIKCFSEIKGEYLPCEKYYNLPLLEVVSLWTKGEMTNFDYLMTLNYLAGRRMGNPNYHPVLPWIMDFTVANGGWRDLTKSKFRLNKGDRQLELTYESLPLHTNAYGDPIQVSHHVSDVLSEITYYVYKARQTPKSFLCRYVRSNWVPAEYPSSMQRMFEWTPDECIPEFFYDADLFRSIHRDLADLEIPWWASSPEDFVAKHRVALESQHVTERLHHWIDLTFGYKLSGSAAVKAKNVCYHLVDQHTNLIVGGVVQLFSQPHPHHFSHSLYLNRRPTCLQHWKNVKKVAAENSPENVVSQMSMTNKDTADDESEIFKFIDKKRSSLKQKTAPSETKSVEHQTIFLPKEYAPLARLNKLEALYTFCLKSTSKVPENQQKANADSINPYHQRHIRDMVVIGCLIVEIFMVNKLKSLRPTATLEERYQLICSVLLTDIFELPRCVRHCVKLLLQLNKIDSLSNLELPKKFPVITEDGLPPPSAHQLLQPLIRVIPFPTYFKNLYHFLCRLKTNDFKSDTSLHCATIVECDLSKIADNPIKVMQRELNTLLPQLSDDGLGLITPYIKDIFTNSQTAVVAAWYLFDTVSQHLGPRQTFHLLIQRIVRLFDVEYPTEKHMKLFHQSYLLQLIVRLGLQTFLNYFSTILIEAVGGCKDFAAKNTFNLNQAEFIRQNPHLRSSEFEGLQWRDSKLPPEVTFSPVEDNQDVSSPFDKSDFEECAVAATIEDHIGAESEIFVFENDDFNAGSVRAEVDTTDGGEGHSEENRDGENSSDSTSGDGLSTGETTIDCPSYTISSRTLLNEDDLKRVASNPEVKRPRSSCSFSEGFPVTGIRQQKLMESESYSSSVPNLASEALRHRQSFSTNVDDGEELSDHDRKSINKSFKSNISDVATETVMWLSHRLGPVLTAKYLSRNLLRMLSLCYLGSEQLEYLDVAHETSEHLNDTNIIVSPKNVAGDKSTLKVLRCLGNIASLYGEQFIVLQYFPHMIEIVAQSKKRVTPSFEAGLIGNLVLIHHIVPCLGDATLMDHLQDTLIKEIMYPTIRLIASSRQQFPNGGHARQIIAYKLLDALCIIGLRIGFEMTRKHLTRIIQKFFSAFSKVYCKSEDVKQKPNVGKDLSTARQLRRLESTESMSPPTNDSVVVDKVNQETAISEELSHAFCPELAYVGYILFCKLAGDIHVGEHLPNYELIHRLYMKHDHALSASHFNTEQKTSSDDSSNLPPIEREPERENKPAVTIVGNRIDIKDEDEEDSLYSWSSTVFTSDGLKRYFKFSDHDVTKLQTVNKQMENDSRHLKGNWLAYWEHELGRNEKDQRFNFKQIILQTFGGSTGHQSGVKTIYPLDNENSFISASKDKTVKLWSLRSHGDGKATSNCQWTYSNHKKSVFSVTFLDSLRLAASCDSTVHVWDPFLGSCLKTFDSNKNSPATVLVAMPAPSPVLITATTEASIRFMDVRALKYMHEFKVGLGPGAGVIRSMAVSPNSHWIAVGYNTGIISILDVRTGLLSSTWKGHDGEILQVKACNDHTFVTSSLDHHCISVWNADDGKLKCQLRGPNEPVHCLSFYKNELISGTTANRIGVHTSVDTQSSFSSTKLQSDTFKGVLTSMTVLPLNRLMLLGADNGAIRLLC
ncbi:hypothetical protein CHUAL_004292 [Chamberlinius hualienensis]